MKHLKIDNTDVFLDDIEVGKGKITISDTYDHNYSYYWGAMGNDTLSKFISRINEDYFASNLHPPFNRNVIDVKKTFANLRKYIREELCLPYYVEMEFQKDLREKLNDFQRECEDLDGDYFVYSFSSFIRNLNYYLINDIYDQISIEDSFNSIEEPWHFIIEKNSSTYKWLLKFHKKLKKAL